MSIIGIDFFGTLDKNTAFWKELLKFVMLEGHKVYVISGPWPKELAQKLESAGYKRKIHWTGAISLLHYMHQAGWGCWYDEMHDSWYSQETPWWPAKAHICKKLGCQMHLDSDMRFGAAFQTTATRFIDTTSDNGKQQINKWYNTLKAANTFEEWGDEYSWMGQQFVPM
jgi:hypothetical protein